MPKRSRKKKNPAAVALGRLGGLKGGKARTARRQTMKALFLTITMTIALPGCATLQKEKRAAPDRDETAAEQQDRKAQERAISDRISAHEQADKEAARQVRITNNPEVVKGCELVGNLTRFEKVKRFQQDVVRADGNVGYVVATNEDGQVIGEAYRCPDSKATAAKEKP